MKLADYSAANQAAISELLTKFNTDIDAQTTEDGVSKIVSSAKNKLLDFATLADEALAAKLDAARKAGAEKVLEKNRAIEEKFNK